jgi:6-pyruvoyltetrahydropterin/6-carboxytetrahydropterin synthase
MPKRAEVPNAGDVYVTRQVHFNAGHRLYNPARSGAWNKRTFGPCANANGHGHNYVLEATVRGRTDGATGYVLNLVDLKRVMETAVVGPCDHRNLNKDVVFLKDVIPTAENLVVAFWRRIAPRVRSGSLHSLRLYETPRNFVEYRGPGGAP